MRGKWVLIGVSIVLLAIAAGALSRLRAPAPQAAATQVRRTEASQPAGEMSLPGKIEARQVVAVGAPVPGVVAEFLVDVGQDVHQGDLLARISNQGLETAHESAKAALDLAQSRADKAGASLISARLEASRARADATRSRTELERNRRSFERQKMLNAEGATPRLVYEKAQRDFEAAQAEFQSLDELARVAESRVDELIQEETSARRILEDKSRDLEQATTNLESAEVHSPVDGLVVGRSADAGPELLKIAVNPAELQVTVNPDPALLKRLQLGDPALILVADLPGEGIPGTVKEVQANQATVEFTSPSPMVKPGMTAQVRIKLAESPAGHAASAPRPPS